ncbi:MAG: carbonic anhydrase, partial [Actinomycetes bacterium]
MSRSTRRQFLTRGITATGVAAASVLGAGALDDLAGAAANPPSTDPATPAEALRRLVKGNQRFVSGNLKASGRGTVRRVRVAYGQEPYAVILTCSDSR